MMLKLLPLTALALGLSSGVALADHRGGEYRGDHRGGEYRGDHRGGEYRGDHRAAAVEHRAAAVVRDHREFRGGEWRGRTAVREGREFHGGGRVIVRGAPYRDYRVVRRPIFVGRPILREHYYNHYRRPALIVENYGAMPGYYWVPGQWSWSGYEWLWQPGHYQPDPSYIDPAYADPGY
jgi:hypothetical protein